MVFCDWVLHPLHKDVHWRTWNDGVEMRLSYSTNWTFRRYQYESGNRAPQTWGLVKMTLMALYILGVLSQ